MQGCIKRERSGNCVNGDDSMNSQLFPAIYMELDSHSFFFFNYYSILLENLWPDIFGKLEFFFGYIDTCDFHSIKTNLCLPNCEKSILG